jgi:hypothetical protein
VITNRNGVFTLEILLGVEDRAVIAFFANPKNHITTKAIEAVTYGAKKLVQNPLENEARSNEDEVTRTAEDTIKSTTLDVDTTDTENTSDSKLGILTPTLEYASNDTLSKGLATRDKLKKQTINHAITARQAYIS